MHPDDVGIYRNRMTAPLRNRAAPRPEISNAPEGEAPAGGKHALEIETVNSKGEARRVVIVPGEADQAVIGGAVAKRDRKAAARLAAKAKGASR